MLASWWRKCKRRKPGIYLARTEKHLRPGRYENGYVGKSVNVNIRKRQHMGEAYRGRPTGWQQMTLHREVDRMAGTVAAPIRQSAQPWSDLAPQWRVLRLPWWAGWPWILLPLEFLAIRLLLPRYNIQHNHGNPRRIRPEVARAQRLERDGAPPALYVKRRVVRYGYVALRVAGTLLILTGLAGWMVTR